MARKLVITLLVLAGILLVIQLVPYGRDHTNPPVVQEPQWDSPDTRALAATTCFNCHSNETVWPWYSSIAPVSWLVGHDVAEGRGKMNFSEWQLPQEDAHEAAEVVAEGEMPPAYYTIMHSEARLSDADRAALAEGLRATIGDENERGGMDDND
jgi:mono/diheme cytochrome c family protein